MTPTPRFSIVLATRDRAELFALALQSVIDQTCADTEIVVVNDGSSPEALPAYEAVYARARAQLGDRLQTHLLVRRPRGHGQSYSLNFGVDQARGEYVGFLDDDDVWVDSGHLARADQVLRPADGGSPVDLYMGNQDAFLRDERLPGPIWLGALQSQLQARGRKPDALGAYRVDIAELMAVPGFCHLNCFIVRRALWLKVGGMDEGIRWECDRDIYLRLLDAAQGMVHHPAVTARHHVPDPKAGTSMTTSLRLIERPLWQLRVLDKAALLLTSPLLRAHAREHKGYTLKKVAQQLAAQRDWVNASHYAAQGLGARPNLKWAAYTLWLGVRRWFA